VNATARKLIARIRAAVLTSTTAAFTALHGFIATLLRKGHDVLAGFKPEQIAKATELLEDGAIHQLRDGIYLAVSEDGTQTHRTTVAGHCTCKAGLKTERAGRGCYHVLAAKILEAA
jgi:hypothetical protein